MFHIYTSWKRQKTKQPLKKLKLYGLPKQTILKAVVFWRFQGGIEMEH